MSTRSLSSPREVVRSQTASPSSIGLARLEQPVDDPFAAAPLVWSVVSLNQQSNSTPNAASSARISSSMRAQARVPEEGDGLLDGRVGGPFGPPSSSSASSSSVRPRLPELRGAPAAPPPRRAASGACAAAAASVSAAR